jgi:hypothetical protein
MAGVFSKTQHPAHLVKNPGTRNLFHPTQQAALHNYFHLVITQGGEFNL